MYICVYMNIYIRRHIHINIYIYYFHVKACKVDMYICIYLSVHICCTKWMTN